MKKVIFFLFICILFIIAFAGLRYKLNKDLLQPVNIPTSIPTVIPSTVETRTKPSFSLFVPYWSLNGESIDEKHFDQLIYFGIKPNSGGISMTDQESEQLKDFNDSVPDGIKKMLALRMTGSEENLRILEDGDLQQKIIDQSIEIANENNFEGVVLDMEIAAIPFDTLKKQIDKFTDSFYKACKEKRISFNLAIYGDTFYRARPFDIKTIAGNADVIMIMAYDMHKANGNPGPNFPLGGHENYGYDMSVMTDDFLRFVPAKQITVIFGMFGYDWEVDEGGKSIRQAKPLSQLQIKQKFIDRCDGFDCKVVRDKESGETKISYKDGENKKHVIWFEDMESVKKKQEFLRQKGINSFSYWAYSYF